MNTKAVFLIIWAVVFFIFSAASAGESHMKIRSTAFASEAFIPKEYTCDGTNVAPALAWQDVPSGVKSFALVMDDPDAPAGTWVHWVVYNIPADVRSLSPLPAGTRQGENSFGKTGYGGPCPPKGHGPHRYFFRLYALDTSLDLKSQADSAGLKAAMNGHVLDNAELMGRYEH